MRKYFGKTHTPWELFCSVLMLLAFGITALGSIPFFTPQGTNGPMGGVGDGAFFIIWLFGAFGLFVLFFENTPGRKLFASLGFGGSILGLAWGLFAYPCPVNELCLHDTSGNGWLLAVCLGVLALQVLFEKKKEKLTSRGKFFIKVMTRLLIVVWAIALVFAVVAFNNLHVSRTVELPK